MAVGASALMRKWLTPQCQRGQGLGYSRLRHGVGSCKYQFARLPEQTIMVVLGETFQGRRGRHLRMSFADVNRGGNGRMATCNHMDTDARFVAARQAGADVMPVASCSRTGANVSQFEIAIPLCRPQFRT